MHFFHVLLSDNISSVVIQNTLHEAVWGRTLDEEDLLSEDEQQRRWNQYPSRKRFKDKEFWKYNLNCCK